MKPAADDDPVDISITSPVMLARLLAVGAGGEGAWDADELALLLRQQMMVPLAALGPVEGGAARDEGGRAMTIGDALLGERPDAGALRRIKEHAKSLRVALPPTVAPEVASVLYYAAILAARERLRVRISTMDDATLQLGARWCLGQRWLEGALRELFVRAAEGPAASE